jgi:hypothetical protein
MDLGTIRNVTYFFIVFRFRFAINWDNPSAEVENTIHYTEGGMKMEQDIQQDEGDVSMVATE